MSTAACEVEVVYAPPPPAAVFRRQVSLQAPATVAAAIAASGLLEAHPELGPAGQIAAGVFSRRTALDAPLAAGDRVEVYRPLRARRHGPPR
ncbi:MAG: RnfH family protein [Betaproteobacteria bacterium AqS2]|uniref:UPF0125 protein ISN26_01950 n=1 Tax=Candidatus Amphirhobacter heronislandensis TaxID=1732024 RepID=A0A930XXP1_9GAMM|nr:RnfH family protein [Betaproteobacteria bacterium AqS2]